MRHRDGAEQDAMTPEAGRNDRKARARMCARVQPRRGIAKWLREHRGGQIYHVTA
jgi:hypothetical protein